MGLISRVSSRTYRFLFLNLWKNSTTTTTMNRQQNRVSKVMTQPIQLCFRFLQNQERLEIWLVDQKYNRIEGVLKGFDEYMNLVLDDAVETNIKFPDAKGTNIGRILLKGDNVACIQQCRRETK